MNSKSSAKCTQTPLWLLHSRRPESVVRLLALLIVWLGGLATPRAELPPSPGVLAKVHEKLRCEQCHDGASKQPSKSCLDCHAAIRGSTFQARGLHGGVLSAGKDCHTCHKEHQGPKGDLVGWSSVGGIASLDHGKVGFPFTGGHARFADSPCESCHMRSQNRTLFAKSQMLCKNASCHPDIHAGTAGSDCASCHESASWKLLGNAGAEPGKRFAHNRDTRFVLVGRHKEAAARGRCRSCHKTAVEHPSESQPLSFQVADHSCYGCHRSDDEQNGHRGHKGKDCGGCHLPTVRYFFDAKGLPDGHTRATVPIAGAHSSLPCLDCHKDWQKLTGLADSCITCHQRDDIHHNSLGPRCGDCHTQQSFLAARFRHDSVGCSLRGVHRILPCADCHKSGNYAGLSPMCVSCHRDDAMRAATQGVAPELHVIQTACSGCHNTNSFRLGAGTRQSPPESVCQ